MSKEDEALSIIREAINQCKVPVVGFSGGKDSTVVLDLVRRVAPNTVGVFCNTGIEWPETWKYCRSLGNIIEVKPKKGVNYWKIAEEHGFPGIKGSKETKGANVNRCCEDLKDKPMRKYIRENEVDLVFTGLTMDESRQRMMFLMSAGNKGRVTWVKSWNVNKAHPIWNWSEEEVWEYIKNNNIPYNTVYDDPPHPQFYRKHKCVRCGCAGCTGYISWPQRLGRECPILHKITYRKWIKQRRERKFKSRSLDEWECSGGA